MRRILLFVLASFLFVSCSSNVADESFVLTIKNEKSSAYFIFIKTNEDDDEKFLGAINPGKTESFDFEKDIVLKEVSFYSGVNIETMSMIKQLSYNQNIDDDTVLRLASYGIVKQ